MTRAILTCFHHYQPYGGIYYEPILDFYLQLMRRYENEYDHIYLLDSNWEIDPKKIEGMKASIHRVNPHDRYYDVHRKFIPGVKEDLVLLLDNDLVVYKDGIVKDIFESLEMCSICGHTERCIKDSCDNCGYCHNPKNLKYDVASIYDTIGEYKTDKLNGKNKFCPYLFASRKELLMRYLDVDWGPNLPEYETLGALTREMLNDEIVPCEWEEDKNSIYIDGSKDGEVGRDTGVYHIRAGSVPAVLLAYKHNDEEKYWEYLKNQPKREFLRQCAWYQYMDGNPIEIYTDVGVTQEEWEKYYLLFKKYHNLP